MPILYADLGKVAKSTLVACRGRGQRPAPALGLTIPRFFFPICESLPGFGHPAPLVLLWGDKGYASALRWGCCSEWIAVVEGRGGLECRRWCLILFQWPTGYGAAGCRS